MIMHKVEDCSSSISMAPNTSTSRVSRTSTRVVRHTSIPNGIVLVLIIGILIDNAIVVVQCRPFVDLTLPSALPPPTPPTTHDAAKSTTSPNHHNHLTPPQPPADVDLPVAAASNDDDSSTEQIHADIEPTTNRVISDSIIQPSNDSDAAANNVANPPGSSSNPNITSATSNTTVELPPAPICFYAEEDLCTEPRPESTTTPADCRGCFAHPTVADALVCCNIAGNLEQAIECVPHPQQHQQDSSNIDTNGTIANPMATAAPSAHVWLHIHIRNATLDEIDFSQNYFKRLHSLVITDGHVQRMVREFSKFSTAQCVNVSNNQLQHIHQRAFKELTRLQVLDLSHNNLTAVPNVNSIPANLSLNASGNREMLCKSILESIERGGVHFVDPDGTHCLTNQTFMWFNSTDSVSLGELQQLSQLQAECPKIPGYGSCRCDADQMMYEQSSRQFRVTVRVDCTNMGLIALPEKLPENTQSLNVTGNNITSLMAFNNPSYESILRLEADDNQVESLLDLEGTKFLQNFLVLRLRRNKIRSIPTYVLSNTLDKSPDGRALNLGGNMLHCDCNTATELKMWLIERQTHITDNDAIGCVNLPHVRVIDLSEKKLCQSPHDWTDYIYYLIGLEIILLVALVCKISYDYWVFKTAGYLPWPASKMPKLPCDWLCES